MVFGMHALKVRHLNNFDLLRIIGACLVFVSHSFIIYGRHEPELLHSATGFKEITFGTLGVSIFFVVSGFLITQSMTNSSKLRYFVANRLLRVYPALFLNLLIVTLVILPATTIVNLSEYFHAAVAPLMELTAYYILLIPPKLPGVFASNPIPNAINGPLWTLFYEVLCYAVVGMCGLFNLKYMVPLIAGVFLMYFSPEILAPANLFGLAFIHCASFLLGACAFLYRERISFTHTGAAICAASLVTISFFDLYFIPLY